MPVTPVSTPSAPPVAGPYAPLVRAGDWLVASGQIGVDATGALADGCAAQARQAMRNLIAVFADAGAAVSDIAKTSLFLAAMEDFAAVNEIYAEMFGEAKPARSTIAVAGLPRGALVEIEAWAYVGDR
jgi:2-iminobutanoate/2-iminopropanoate deaminase